MAITPQTAIELYSGIPLDNSYQHTILFSSATAQRNYFAGKVAHTLSNYTYQRVERQYIRVSGKADNYYNCNYMAFQNTAYGSKWFYCFIDSVEYLNDNTAQIEFSLDVMQTYLFDVTLKPSYVEREHSRTDNIGDNIQTDPLSVSGDYIVMTARDVELGEQSTFLLMTMSPNFTGGSFTNNVLTAMRVEKYTPAGEYVIEPIQDALNGAYAEEGGQLVSVFQCPAWFDNEGTTARTMQVEILVNNKVIGNYTPRNNKMFTYPYNFLRISNNLGSTKDYHWELFSQLADSVTFNITGIAIPKPVCLMYPAIYMQVSNAVDYGVLLDDFPECIYTQDGYSQYIASTEVSRGFKVALSTAGLAAGLVTRSPGTIKAAGAALGLSLAGSVDHISDADTLHGNTGGNQLNISMGKCTYTYYTMCINPQSAQVMDSIWDMYGYPCNQIKIPTRHNRAVWDYVKLTECNAIGKVPSEYFKVIKSCYENGITFWHDPDTVLDYTQSNTPLG